MRVTFCIISCARIGDELDPNQYLEEMATAAELQYLATVDGESAFFRALCEAQARPVGMHRHFRMLVVQRELYNLTEQSVSIDALWKKFSTYYDIELLEGNVRLA